MPEMQDRRLPPLKLVADPLVMVLAQVRIAPILRMEAFVPDIQETLRRNGYPRFSRSLAQEFSLGDQVRMNTSVRWAFADKENKQSVLLAPDFIVLQTARYDVFDVFSEAFEMVLETIGKHTDAELAERLGLRYVNLVVPHEGETLDEYLRPGLHGLQEEDLDVGGSVSRYQVTGETPVGTIVVRVNRSQAEAFLPADLSGADLAFNLPTLAPSERAILDIDHFSEVQRDFVPEGLAEGFWQLHDFTDLAFRASVTETALKRWGAEVR